MAVLVMPKQQEMGKYITSHHSMLYTRSPHSTIIFIHNLKKTQWAKHSSCTCATYITNKLNSTSQRHIHPEQDFSNIMMGNEEPLDKPSHRGKIKLAPTIGIGMCREGMCVCALQSFDYFRFIF